MAIGDQNDMLGRLRSVLPARWFASTTPGLDSSTPVLDGLLAGPAWVTSWLYNLLEYVSLQRRLATATDMNLDLIGRDFFGLKLQRRGGELDASYRIRLQTNLFSAKNTRASVIAAVKTLTGIAPLVFEPANTSDTGGYGHLGMTLGSGLGYGVAGGYGSLMLPFQAFVQAFRPHGGGIAGSQGYYSRESGLPAIGGYGVAGLQYGNLDMILGVISDADILQTIADTAPVATILWTAVDNAPGLPSAPISLVVGRLSELAGSQTLNGAISSGLPSAVLVKLQASQTLVAGVVPGPVTARLQLAQIAQGIASSGHVPVTWNPSDLSGITLSNANVTAATSSASQAGVRSTSPITSGLYYVELTATTALSGQRFGFANPTWSETSANGLGGDTNSISIAVDGTVRFNNIVIGHSDAITAGAVIGMAINKNTNTAFFRINGGGWGTPASAVSGSASAGTTGVGPVISGPSAGSVTIGNGLTVTGCTVSDSTWPTTSTVSMVVSCSKGSVSMTLSGNPVAGSGTASISLGNTSANIQAALGTLSYTAGAAAGTDTITITITDQFSQVSSLAIPVTLNPASDPTAGTGGFRFSSIGAGPIMVAVGANVSGASVNADFGDTFFAQPIPTGYLPWSIPIGNPPTAPVLTTSGEASTSVVLNWTASS